MSDRPPEGPPILELRDVSRLYSAAGNPTYALRSASLTVREGEFVAIVGPSGAGKSTLLNIIGLLDQPTTGTHLLGGVNVRTLSERDRDHVRSHMIGFVFQDSHMLLDESAADNASLGLKVRGTPISERRAQVGQALGKLGMQHRASERSRNLSGGERQRVALARAIATQPRLLLADEPTGALDSVNSARIIDHLTALNRAGVTIVVITHDPTVAVAAGRQIRLSDGVLNDEHAITGGAGENPHVGQQEESSSGRTHHRTHPPRRHQLRGLWDEVLDAVSSHSARPGRTALLLAAFLLGTGGLVCSIGISQSAAAQVSERLTAASLDEVVVRSADTNALDNGFYARSDDASAIPRITALDGVEEVGFVVTVPPASAGVTRLDPASSVSEAAYNGTVIVADSGYLTVQEAETTPTHSGALLDNDWNGRVAILGTQAAETLGIAAIGPGQRIWVSGTPVEVVGIITSSVRNSTLRSTVVLSPAAADGLTYEDPRLIVRTRPGYPAPLSDAIPLAVNPGDPTATKIETVADLRSLRTGVATDLGTLVGLISTVLLVLASLSAATAMYLSVQARSSEIGLRRAIGASRASIWRIFTLEGLIIGAAGGIAGSALGLSGIVVVCIVQKWTATLDPASVMMGLLIGCVTGVLSAAYPALVAARANPAQAIKR